VVSKAIPGTVQRLSPLHEIGARLSKISPAIFAAGLGHTIANLEFTN